LRSLLLAVRYFCTWFLIAAGAAISLFVHGADVSWCAKVSAFLCRKFSRFRGYPIGAQRYLRYIKILANFPLYKCALEIHLQNEPAFAMQEGYVTFSPLGHLLTCLLCFAATSSAFAEDDTDLDRDPYSLELSMESDFFTSLEPDQDSGSSWSGEVEAVLEADFELLWGWRGWAASVVAKANRGDALAAASGEILPFSGAADDRGQELEEFWLQKDLLDGQVSILAGQYSAENEFDLRETAGIFVNGGFEEGPELAELGGDGGAVTPLPGLGARLAIRLPGDFTIRLALVEGEIEDADPEEPADAGYFHIAELNWRPESAPGARYGLGAWYHSGDFRRLDLNADRAFEQGTSGYYAFAEGEIFRAPQAAGPVVSGFVRLGFADDGVSELASHQSAGLTVAGLIAGRDEDVLGLGVTSISNSQAYRSISAQEGEPLSDRETAVELTYQARLAEGVILQPSVQCVFNRNSDPEQDRVCAAGLRLALEI
jgi:porin